jgi:uncharacterized protein YbjQ (UPF0145 family)
MIYLRRFLISREGSKTYQKNLRAAKDSCSYELREEADKIGGNAVIAVDLD